MKRIVSLILLLLCLAFTSCVISFGGEDTPVTCKHNWGEPVEKKEATCQSAGTAVTTCSLCGTTKEVELEKLDHHVLDTENGSLVTKQGKKYKRCSCFYCNYTEDVEIDTETCTHVWGSGTVTKAATCKADGVKTFTCTICSQTKTETIPQLTTHAWNSGVDTKAATCIAAGVKTYTCTVCSATKTETIPQKTTHSWNGGVVTKSATCAATGIKTYTCIVCSTTKTEVVPQTTTHSWNSGVVTKTASCTVAGSKTFTCTVCSATKTETVKALGHQYEDRKEMTTVFHFTDWATTNGLTLSTDSSKTAPNGTATFVTRKDTYLELKGSASVQLSVAPNPTLAVYNLPNTASADYYVVTVSLSGTSAGEVGSGNVSLCIYDAQGKEYCLIDIGRTTGNAWTCTDNGVSNTDVKLGCIWNGWLDVVIVLDVKNDKAVYYVNGEKKTEQRITLPDAFAKVAVNRGTTSLNGITNVDNFSFYYGTTNVNALNSIFKANNATGTTYPTYEYDADGYIVTKAATCKEAGTKTATCSVCGETVTEVIPKSTTHTLGTYTITKEPTDTATGTKTAKCTLCGTTVTETIPALGTGHVWSTDTVLLTEPTSSAAGKYYVYCTECGARKATGTTKTYSAYTSEINALKSSIASSSLGTSYIKLSTTTYNAPTKLPTQRTAATAQYPSSPRVLINADDIVALRNAFADPEMGSTLDSIVGLANNYDSCVLGSQTYHSSSGGYGPKGTHNCDEHILETVTAQALLYQITGADLYGYKAIKIIKEYISTVKITTSGSYKVNDACRTYGYVMFTAAIVYDWCHDLLTETDKQQIIYGVQKNLCSGMEVGFPPSGQSSVAGHGSERQILRDYLSFAIAIYDDEPTWYQYIAGRVYQEYVPVRNAYYSAGYTPQGLSTYLTIRFTSDLWSAWLLKAATGENPYNESDMKNVMKSVYANFVYATTFAFEEGDDEGKSAKQKTLNLALPAMMSAYLLDDATGEVWARKADYSYIASCYLFILKTGTKDLEKLNDRYDAMDYITYNGGFESRIIAHNSWTKNDAAIFMKIGNKTTANHDHADAGSFQIYYKALLTGDSGYYDSYGSTHHTKYHQATVAHNSILIYNGSTGYGQNQPGESGNYATWSGTKYDTGETLGVAYAYDQNGNPLYAYIAGELSGCYDTSAGASRVERRMLTVYDTENADAPMYFFVYDVIKTSSTSYRKAFLLHTPTEPIISGNTVTVVNGSGKLVLQNVTDNAITEQGQYVVNGSEISPKSGDDGMWGRVEISASGKQENFMVNAMYVTEASKNLNLTATKISSSTYTGAQMGKVVAIFMDSADRVSSNITFTASGSGDMNYYVSGVAAGTWTATVGGKTVTAVATEEGGLLSFTAPAGTVTLTKN